MSWFIINNIDTIDSPALVIYKERVIQNIRHLLSMVNGNINALRPHVKTNKIAEVCTLMMDHGITKFKCATVAEAEMLATIQAPDVLLAYQPVGPKIDRYLKLVQAYPQTSFSCLIDTIATAEAISKVFSEQGLTATVFIDIDNGMHRTGIAPAGVFELYKTSRDLPGISMQGLHAYDGHIRDTDVALRQQKSDDALKDVWPLLEAIKTTFNDAPRLVAGGSPSFPTHAHRQGVECSPGTFVFWDWGYKSKLPDEPFDYAALVVTRIISITSDTTLCLDLGHKSVAAENPLPRVHFLNVPDAEPIAQSEEHLVVKMKNTTDHKVGEVWYGVPVHICPTVALYDKAYVVAENNVTGSWKVVARDRSIGI